MRALRPGAPDSFALSGAEVSRPLPPQWSIYRAAWSIAVAILSRSSPLGRGSGHLGVSIAIEAWPLLETLLGRTLQAAAMLSLQSGTPLTVGTKSRFPFMEGASATMTKHAEPDGRLLSNGVAIASFEAKYKRARAFEYWPDRSDIYQALVAAAATGSRLSVLVYPQEFEAILWTINGFGGRPAQMAAIGLGLFNYRQGIGDLSRGTRILQLLQQASAA
jgi:hypothetical protein